MNSPVDAVSLPFNEAEGMRVIRKIVTDTQRPLLLHSVERVKSGQPQLPHDWQCTISFVLILSMINVVQATAELTSVGCMHKLKKVFFPFHE